MHNPLNHLTFRTLGSLMLALSPLALPAAACVSGPDAGAMGVHFVPPPPDRVGDGVLDADAPEFLIYEPLPGGAMRLVGVEFVVLAADWEHKHPKGGTPA